MAYNHGVRVKEQATSLVAPVTGTAGLQVIIGTAPVNLAADPYKATNVPMIAYSFSEAVEQVGYSDDFKNYTLCQSMDACFRVLNVAPIILINVLDPKKHKKANEEQTVNVEKMQATVKVAGILADTVEVKANEATLTAGTDYITTFDDDGYLVITLTAGGKGASAKTLTVNSTSIDLYLRPEKCCVLVGVSVLILPVIAVCVLGCFCGVDIEDAFASEYSVDFLALCCKGDTYIRLLRPSWC